ncbi:hypothetical protein SAMN04489716_7633 [Actinoplanes derwentensis]|uniref:PPE family protein n=1 Tax=Actinoplanes derwentensis TaxID=113562 RepID=A0A1H2D2J6_9ACTN|nr:hypothetical protein Ade03nite_89250 [Actinoplanes derwentensis]SDT76476.1 hypothetical protein SAMN04489716_7633 [Actinoplanes derwentensis]
MARYDDSGLAGDINWSSSDLPYMWEMVSGHESGPYQPAVDGWRRSYELVLIHRTRVEAYKDKLIQAWPPERNKAARAYVERLDQLIESLNETYEASVANYTTFSSAISAVASAKSNMKPLQEEFASNTTLLAKHEEDLQHLPTKYTPPKSPVANGRQEQLRQEAAVIMTSLSAELAAAQTSLVHPRPYSPNHVRDDQVDSVSPGISGMAIPTPTPSASSGRTTSRTRPSNSVVPHPDNQRGITTPDRTKTGQPATINNPSHGPILGGAKPNPSSPSPGLPGTPTNPTGTIPPSTSTPGPYNFPPSTGPSSTTLPRYPATNGTPTGGLPLSPGPAGARGTAGAHGNVIGGSPALGGPNSGRGGQPGPSARGTQKANPVGGMIGQDGASRPGQRRSARDNEEADRLRWDPDNPWETENGVDPILLPAQEQRIDPGPSIGGR